MRGEEGDELQLDEEVNAFLKSILDFNQQVWSYTNRLGKVYVLIDSVKMKPIRTFFNVGDIADHVFLNRKNKDKEA